MSSFTTGWPWLSLAATALLLALVFASSRRRQAASAARALDTRQLAMLGLAAYMLHQFEEHGIDLQGHAYAFLGQLCTSLGFGTGADCPIPTSFITAVNPGTVWIAFAIAILAGPARPAVALSAYAIPLINAPVHIIGALIHTAYNPGLFTSVAVLLPVTVWALRSSLRAGEISWRDVALIALGGVVIHAVLMISLLGYLAGWYGTTVLVGVQLANALVPSLVVLAGQRRVARQVSQPLPHA